MSGPSGDVTRLTASEPVAAAEAAGAVEACFGLRGELTRLPGEADDNFLLAAASGAPGGVRYVVKFAHQLADPRFVDLQVRALRHIEAHDPGLPVPRVVPTAGGLLRAVVAEGPLCGRLVHVLSYLDGQLLRSAPSSVALRRALGATLARLGLALRGFDDPLVRRPLLWDLAQLPQLRPLLAERSPGPGTHLLDEQLTRLTTEVSPRLANQRTQVVHNDFSPDNVLVSADPRGGTDGAAVTGIIDFGDVIVTALVNDVAIAATQQLAVNGQLITPALDLIAGYHATIPLTTDELGLLPDLILGRIVARIIISEWRAARFPENRRYVLRNTPGAWDHLHRLLTIGAGEFAARIQEATRA
jgi:hydroxylysine kinase